MKLTEHQKTAIAAETSPTVVLLVHHPEPFLQNRKGDLLQQVSSVQRLVRITAWVLRFARNARKCHVHAKGAITAEEYLVAEALWIRHEQNQYFAEEIRGLAASGETGSPKKSKLGGLNLFIEDGMLRGRGRLENSALPRDSIHPIVLSAQSKFTELIIRRAHVANDAWRSATHDALRPAEILGTRNASSDTQHHLSVHSVRQAEFDLDAATNGRTATGAAHAGSPIPEMWRRLLRTVLS